MLTVRDNCHSRNFIDYIAPVVGKMPYYFWPGGIVPDSHGPYAFNGPAPRHSYLLSWPGNIFCAGVPTLALRLAGKRVPIAQLQSELYDGGIAAYFGSPALHHIIGAGYFDGFTEPFNMTIALKWARETRQLVLLGTEYRGVHLGQQGHTSLLLPSGYVLQSVPAHGLNWKFKLGQAGDGGPYQVMAHPTQWLEYKGDKIHAGGLWRA